MKINCKKYYTKITPEEVEKNFVGYEVKELRRFMKKHKLLDKWSNWYIGQTGAIVGEKLIVYHWDVERFLAEQL